MTITTFPEVATVAQRYDELVRGLAQRYGARSIAVLIALQEHLLTELDLLRRVPERGAAIRQAIDRLVADVRWRYEDVPVLPPVPAARRSDGAVIEFDRESYVARYGSAARSIQDHVVSLDGDAARHLTPLRTHLFVVDEDHRLVVYTRPYRVADVLLGRTNGPDGVRVTHPMLVDRSLRARAAGELAIVGDDPVTAVVANLRSGHFRPSPGCAEVVSAVVRRCVPTARDVIVFAVGREP